MYGYSTEICKITIYSVVYDVKFVFKNIISFNSIEHIITLLKKGNKLYCCKRTLKEKRKALPRTSY